jgi:hypothetical protein
MIMAQGLFHLKRNVGAFIHVGSWYKIECKKDNPEKLAT